MASTRKSPARARPPRPASQLAARPHVSQPVTGEVTQRAPRVDAAHPDNSAQTGNDLEAFADRVLRQVLAVTYWFEPVPRPDPYPVTIRFIGRRVGVAGQLQRGDQFVHDETIKEVIPGSGPIAVTAKIHDLNPGEWDVKASPVVATRPQRGRQEQESVLPLNRSRYALPRLWLHWAPPVEPGTPVKTRMEPFIRVPGTLPYIWAVMVTLGMVVAVVVELLLAAHAHLAVGPVATSTLIAIAVGIVGAKVWYVVKHWRERSFIGWCIQGFITGATIAAVITFTVTRVPLGAVLDATAPGLMFGLAVGRIGCFLAGCCGGPSTASRWGVWCSDQHIGARRVPTQLMESLFSLSLGLVTLVAVSVHGPAGGAYFVAVLAAYTLFREGVLRLRAEPLTTRLPIPVTPLVSALVLVAALIVLAR